MPDTPVQLLDSMFLECYVHQCENLSSQKEKVHHNGESIRNGTRLLFRVQGVGGGKNVIT